MKIVIIIGFVGFIGSEVVCFFYGEGYCVIGIDNNMCLYFFGEYGDISWNKVKFEQELFYYIYWNIDIWNFEEVVGIFCEYFLDIVLVIYVVV